MKDEVAPVSIRNLRGLPMEDEIRMYGKWFPCTLMSMYPVGLEKLAIENFHDHQCSL